MSGCTPRAVPKRIAHAFVTLAWQSRLSSKQVTKHHTHGSQGSITIANCVGLSPSGLSKVKRCMSQQRHTASRSSTRSHTTSKPAPLTAALTRVGCRAALHSSLHSQYSDGLASALLRQTARCPPPPRPASASGPGLRPHICRSRSGRGSRCCAPVATAAPRTAPRRGRGSASGSRARACTQCARVLIRARLQLYVERARCLVRNGCVRRHCQRACTGLWPVKYR